MRGLPRVVSERDRRRAFRLIDGPLNKARFSVIRAGDKHRVTSRAWLALVWKEEGFRTLPALQFFPDEFEDTDALQQGRWLQIIRKQYALTFREIALSLGRSEAHHAKLVQLHQISTALCPEVIERVDEGDLPVSLARHLVGLSDSSQLKWAGLSIAHSLSERELLEKLAGSGGGDVDVEAFARVLSDRLGARVGLQKNGRGWRLKLEFQSASELCGIFDNLLAMAEPENDLLARHKQGHRLQIDFKSLDALEAMTAGIQSRMDGSPDEAPFVV